MCILFSERTVAFKFRKELNKQRLFMAICTHTHILLGLYLIEVLPFSVYMKNVIDVTEMFNKSCAAFLLTRCNRHSSRRACTRYGS